MNDELLRSLGMAIVHLLWEGILILIVVVAALALAGKKNARVRYLILLTGHGLLITGFFVTWFTLYKSQPALQPYNAALTSLTERWQGIVNAHAVRVRPETLSSFFSRVMDPLYPYIATGWFLGFLVMIVRMSGAVYVSHIRVRKHLTDPGPALSRLFTALKTRLGLPESLQLRLSSRLVSPMVIGIVKPCVIIPAAILSGLNPNQVEAILVHELAHIRRYDHVIMIVQTLITRILFFHPVAWYFSSEINTERENCCDDTVITTCEDPINYIKALTMIQELNMDGYVPANALLGKSKKLLGRIRRLLKKDEKHTPVYRFAFVFTLLAIAGLATITIMTSGKPEPSRALTILFSPRAEKPVAVKDTLKKQQKQSTTDQTDQKLLEKKQKELEEATRKLEKAQLQVVWAQREVERAMQEMEKAGGRRHDGQLADLEAHRDMADQQMRMLRMQQNQMRHNQDMYRQRQWREMSDQDRRKMEQEWSRADQEMRKARREFRFSEKDSMFMKHNPRFFIEEPPMPGSPDMVPPPAPEIGVPTPPEPPADVDMLKEEPKSDGNLDEKLQELEEK
jgi:bla regulator protein blaR1